MKSAIILATMGLALAGCGYSGGNDVTASRDETKEGANYGSATDIAQGDGSVRSTNELNSADNGLGGPANRQTGNYQSQELPGQTSDEELAKKIKVALTTGSLGTTGVIAENQLGPVDVKVENGAVTLTGAVSSEGEKQSFEKRVANMKGVKSVNNQLTVGGRNLQDKPLQPIYPNTKGNQ